MKKIIVISAVLAMLVTLAAAAAAVEIKLSHSGPTPATGATNDEGCKAFKQYVEDKSGGDIKVVIFPNNQLGNEREQMEGVQMETIQMCSISTGTLSSLDPQMLVIDIPYLFSSKAVAYKFLDGPVGDRIRDGFREKTGTVMLAYGENGFRHFTNRVRPIKSVEDLKGLKIRTQENPAHIAMMKSFGSTPAPIPFGELYTALSQGVVDGQENPVSLTESSRLHEVQKYLTLDGHFYSPFVLIINGSFFNGLTPEQQEIIREGAKAWSVRQREFNTADEKRALEEMRKYGTEITELNEQQQAEFRAKAREGALPLIEKEVGKPFIEEVMKGVAEAEK
jgi:C4-dicarboxylate-binding protein DctP